ncbi:SDR family NAD(P)-dependent oxidoreductase [Mycolicibacterium baixiangningiae]|uniref:SDR family NAD(P)-dependent oxidoreductase n=1 Tax=Mycolicibacterium baixiangningiae TaxID=2761578 RepID=UPI0018684A44|nr:SDR family NAD(P)-dependent oxidoreductase [Mycolicibacterium baixiangningiae]
MAGRTIVITGASDGVGAAAAKRLTRSGENVVVVGRSPQKTAAVAGPLGADSFVADFADLAQVRELARRLLETYPRIDVLANNAGGMMNTREMTVDGFEKTFQVNHLAPLLLTTLLLDRLVESGASVLNTSSMANKFARVDFDDLDAVQQQNGSLAYGTSKLANILFTKELHRRYHPSGISTAAFHPGPVASNFSAEVKNPLYGMLYRGPLRHIALIGTEQGSDELVWLASAAPGVDWRSGQYYYKHKVARANKLADDAGVAERLWDRSLQLLDVKAVS